MQNKTLSLVLSPRVTLVSSVTLLAVTAAVAFIHPSFMILTGFFIVQILVKILAKDETKNMPFIECLLIGPLKLIISGVALMVWLLPDTALGDLVWIAIWLLFFCSGMQNIYWIISGDYDFEVISDAAPMMTRQQMETEQEEAALLADLASSLSDPDAAEKGRTGV